MKNWTAIFLTALCSVAITGAALAQSHQTNPSVSGVSFATRDADDVNAGVAAYRAGDYGRAWALLEPAAKSGEAKAQRYLGYILLDGKAPTVAAENFFDGVALLKQAAVAGDYAALIRLEDLRRQGLAHSPSLDDMIEIETLRAAKGDPVAAWRLARRYEDGEGVVRSEGDEAKWLEVAAAVEPDVFPKAGEAAFRLCEIRAMGAEARDPSEARRWCALAAENGHAGAAIVLRRLASLDG